MAWRLRNTQHLKQTLRLLTFGRCEVSVNSSSARTPPAIRRAYGIFVSLMSRHQVLCTDR